MNGTIAIQIKKIFRSEIAHFIQQMLSMYKKNDKVETIDEPCMA